jgi:hypothetical protein
MKKISKEFEIKYRFIKYFNWFIQYINEEMSKNTYTVKEVSNLLEHNEFLHLLAMHIYNIKRIILNDSTLYSDFIYNICYCQSRFIYIIQGCEIDTRNINVLSELLNHDKFYSYKPCYNKQYWFRNKLVDVKLEL